MFLMGGFLLEVKAAIVSGHLSCWQEKAWPATQAGLSGL